MSVCHSRKYRHLGRGFTLLEVLLALALMGILLVGVWDFYANALRARQIGNTISHEAMLMRALLDRMAEEIRQTASVVPGDGIGFSGTQDRITIVKLTLPETYAFDEWDPKRTDLPPAQMDIRRISYELLWDEELTDDEGVELCHGLWRSEQKTFDPNPKYIMEEEQLGDSEFDFDVTMGESENAPTAEGELVAPEIKYLKFEYYDGAQWQTEWDTNKKGANTSSGTTSDYVLPQAVRITVGHIRVPRDDEEFDISEENESFRKPEYHPDRFTAVVPLLEADRTLLSSRKYGVKRNLEAQMGGSE